MRRLEKQLGQLFGIALLLNMIIELLSRKSLPALAAYLFGSPFVFLLNTLLILTPFLVVLFVRRKVFAASVLTVIALAMGIANGVLLIFRTTPFTATDLRMVKYAAALLTTYLSWWQIVLGAAALILAVVLCALLWKRAPKEQDLPPLMERVCVGAAAMAVIWGALNLSIFTGLVELHFGNIGQAYQDYGFAYCFANSAFNTGIEKPADYDSEAVAKIEEEGMEPEPTADPGKIYPLDEYRTPNIIMVQLESFFDPDLWENNPVEEISVPFFRLLKRKFPSGYLSVPSVGAGTANTEFECITGMNLDFFGPGEYPYKTILQKTSCESIAYDLRELGYRTHAIHNNEGTFYDRHKVFPQLGFETFTPIEYMYHTEKNPTGWCKDQVLVEEIGKALDSTVGQDFIYTISVQGHGKYPSFEYYCEQIREMDEFIRKLTVALGAREEPTVLVLYGDHLPGFSWTESEMKNRSLFQTEYVVWNNMGLPNVKKDVESYQLAAHVTDMLNIHEGTMFRFHQRHLEADTTGARSYTDAMKILQYDMLYGDRMVYGGESPYKTVKMEMGVTPIIQRTTLHVGDQILVFGENFNEYSRICVDGKPVDTPYIRGNRLIAPNVPYKEGEEITVKQIGRDKVALGTARIGPGA